MDETPIKAARAGPGKLKQSWFWPLYGDKHEVNFTFSTSRGRRHVEKTLCTRFSGTLLSDGYSAYASYVQANAQLTHAQCWAHSRRKFIEAEAAHPAAAREALGMIAALYKVEAEGDAQQLDTNHLERALRPIPMGRRNWLFCWTELGAEHVGIIQSLITTCRLQDINPYTYLTDVLLRVGQHPASKVEQLAPRLWKAHFADAPFTSDLFTPLPATKSPIQE